MTFLLVVNDSINKEFGFEPCNGVPFGSEYDIPYSSQSLDEIEEDIIY